MSLNLYLRTDPCPHCGRADEVLDFNITHNLGRMAGEAGIYTFLWRPEEIGVKWASQLIVPLEEALAMMVRDPDRFRDYDASNGWGTFDQFLPWLMKVLDACRAHPDAEVRASR